MADQHVLERVQTVGVCDTHCIPTVGLLLLAKLCSCMRDNVDSATVATDVADTLCCKAPQHVLSWRATLMFPGSTQWCVVHACLLCV